MVAIVAMILGYLVFCDVKVAIYIGLGFVMAKWMFSTIYKEVDRRREDED